MKCPICNGSGVDNRCDRLSCYECGGSGEILTNEEWIKSCNTEQLAEFLLNAIQDCKSCATGIGLAEKPDDMPCPFGGCWDVKDVLAWLKQPHK